MGKACPSLELLSAYRDGETTPDETALVARHLPGCSTCQATVSAFDHLTNALAATPELACPVVLPVLSAQIDGEASVPEIVLVGRHLASCESCDARRAAWERLDAAIAALPEAFPSPAADAKIRALAVHARTPRPSLGRALASLTLIVSTVALALVNTLSGGVAPLQGAAPQGGQTAIVASVAQQLYNPSTGLLYVLQPAPASAVVVRDVARRSDVKTILLGGAPAFMAMNAKAQSLYVVDPAARTYTDIDTDTNEIRARVPLDVRGTPTSIAVDADTGKLVVATEPAKAASGATAPAATAKPQLAIIDPSSRTLEVVKQVDVAPTRIVVDAIRGRLFLLASTGTSVLDARTYQTIEALPSAAVAVAAGPERTALLVEQSGDTVLTFYQAGGSGRFHGRPAGLFALADGGFALLVEDGGTTRIVLANADGSDRGTSLAVPAGSRGLTFDAASGRFLDASGTAVAAISAGALVTVAPTIAPTLAVAPTAPPATLAPEPTVAPATNAPATNAPTANAPLVVLPTPSPAPTLFPGAVLSAGLYRYELPGVPATVAMVAGDGRLWYAGRDGTLRTIDPATGVVTLAGRLGGGDAQVSLLSYGAQRVFAMDVLNGNLFAYDTRARTVTQRSVPFGQSISAMDVAPDGALWLATTAYSGLLSYDPRGATFGFVPLPAGAVVTALSIDIAGRVWFYDQARGMLESYEPATALRTEYAMPFGDPVRVLRSDPRGSVWLATAGRSIYRLFAGALTRVSTTVGPVQSMTLAPDGQVVLLVDAGSSKLFGTPDAGYTVVSAHATAIAVDGSGHVWAGDGFQPVFYISQATR